MMSRMTIGRLMFGGCMVLAACLMGCAAPGGLANGAATGDERFDAMLTPVAAGRDSNLGRYVQEIGRRLQAGAKALRDEHAWPSTVPKPADWMLRDVQFHVVEGAAPNVFTPGGPHVYATAGLLRACETEDQFAAAVAHVYAHILCRHLPTIRAPRDEQWTDDRLALAHVNFHYTSEQELAADDLAVLILARSGWSADAYASMVNAFAGNSKHLIETRQRLSDVGRRVATLPTGATDWPQPPVADRKRFAANQKLAATVTWITPTDAASAKRARLIVAAYPNCINDEDSPEQIRARAELQPPVSIPEDNPWGKGLPPPRQP